MGNISCKFCEGSENNKKYDLNKEDNENILNKARTINPNRNKFHNINFFNINDILSPASTITNKNNNSTDEQYINENKIIKIQKYYRNRFNRKIKPLLYEKNSEYIQKLKTKLSSNGDVTKNLSEFSSDNWKLFYPSHEKFFLFSKGEVDNDQIRIKNINDMSNIEIYEGEINSNNKKHGNGILTNPYYVLKGTWREDEFTGWGIKCMRNGDTFEGKFINGDLNGKGIYKNGKIYYKGDFIKNERNGIGDLTTENYHYIGEFKNNKFEGKGEIDFFEDGQKYEGTFSDNKINGKGTYKWKNGDVYEGEMKDGKKHGFGKYTFSDGKIYEGDYVNDIRKGKGKLIEPNGKSYEGNFTNGELDGEVICKINNKIYNKALFSKGKFVRYLQEKNEIIYK